MTVLTIIFGVISAAGGLGGVLAVFYIGVTRRKIGAEARKIGVDADDVMAGRALEMYELAKKESSEAKAEARSCHDRLSALEDHVDKLERQMRDNGMDPPPFLFPIHQIGGN